MVRGSLHAGVFEMAYFMHAVAGAAQFRQGDLVETPFCLGLGQKPFPSQFK